VHRKHVAGFRGRSWNTSSFWTCNESRKFICFLRAKAATAFSAP